MSAFSQTLEQANREEAECMARDGGKIPDTANELHNAWLDGYRAGLRGRNKPVSEQPQNPHDPNEKTLAVKATDQAAAPPDVSGGVGT